MSAALLRGLGPVAIVAAMQAAPAAMAQEHSHEHGAHSHATPGKPGRTIAIDMSDGMRFSPASINVKQGETVRFLVTNSGKVKHEMVIGPMQELMEHAKLMQKFPDMEHEEANQVAVPPGETRALVWRFDKTGKVDFACLQPGHFEAGMKGQVTVNVR